MYLGVVLLLSPSGIKPRYQPYNQPLLFASPIPPPLKFQFTELNPATYSRIHSIRSRHIKLHIGPYNFACLLRTLCSESLCDVKLSRTTAGSLYLCKPSITLSAHRYAISHTNTLDAKRVNCISCKTQWTGCCLCSATRLAQYNPEILNLF
jgi:hypothetical protein